MRRIGEIKRARSDEKLSMAVRAIPSARQSRNDRDD